MARTVREKGRPSLDWDKLPPMVKDWRMWAEDNNRKASWIQARMYVMRQFHDFLVAKLDSHYYDSDPRTPTDHRSHPNWEDAREWKSALLANAHLAGDTKRTYWQPIVRFFEWRANAFPKDVLYERDNIQVQKAKGTSVFGGKEGTEGGAWQAYQLEHVAPIFDAAKSYATYKDHGNHGDPIASEDYELISLMLHTGDSMRDQALGLRWDQVHFEKGVILTQTKTSKGRLDVLPVDDELRAILQVHRERNPKRRMVFRNGLYPHFDKIAAAPGTPCAKCGATENVYVYAAPEKDVAYCKPHLTRELGRAFGRNRSYVGFAHDRIEKALHARNPELRDEVLDQKTKQYVARPLNLHGHRWRKTFVTHGRALGLTREEVAKVSKHSIEKSDVMDNIYDLPDIETQREIAGRVDFVDASRRAARGEKNVLVKSADDVLREENAALRAQVSALTSQLTTMGGQLTEILSRLPKNGGGP